MMTLEQIKAAVDAELPVRWSNDGYHVRKDNQGEYYIIFIPNGYTIRLTWQDGITMNGDPSEFYIAE